MAECCKSNYRSPSFSGWRCVCEMDKVTPRLDGPGGRADGKLCSNRWVLEGKMANCCPVRAVMNHNYDKREIFVCRINNSQSFLLLVLIII